MIREINEKEKEKEMELEWISDDYIAERISEQRKPNIYPYVEKVKNLSESGFNSLLSRERDWYILQVHTLRARCYRPITMFIVGYAPKFTEIINGLREG